ncbi:DUF3068 domain-containing protein [Spongiactinospora sp. TRM90649]|uniref:DUF3068 domain-containing protein n=1 Tax=Spongiactinospora sp. TRM90649 TaxID=3031114 RepID=UPI0023F84556|nr:DUF3068 domain-containing protein [Spongiactinospora sp. TRM90649]MDF5751056.1 DUF3068 domain-containing protein [Spongiactinospora sp. TRM90649]
MRRVIGLVLIGMGAFLLVLAPLIRFWAAPRLIAAPADYYLVTRLEAPGGQYFSVPEEGVVKGDLKITITTRGDVGNAAGDRVVWDEFMSVDDVTNETAGISYIQRRSAFDKYSGIGVNCCGTSVDREPVEISGQVYKFPFDVEKKTYPVFNATARKAFDAEFAGEDVVDGLTVYRFEQRVPATKIRSLSMPAGLLDLPGDNGDTDEEVDVDRYYEGTNTYWIEPVSGSQVKQEQQRHDVLRTRDGVDRSVAFSVDAKMTGETVRALADNARAARGRIATLRTNVPLSLTAAGAAVFVTGLVVALRRRRRAH